MTPAMTAVRIPDLDGKAVLITGASTGIGAALARTFAAQGALVGLHYNASVAAAEALAAEIEAGQGRVRLIRADVSAGSGARSAVDQAVAAFGRLDGLINTAGGMVRRVPYAEASEKDYDEIMDLNARSVIVASQAAIAPIKAAGGGFIINTTSIAARNGASGGAGLYGSSKAFVHNVTRGMAKELIPFGIRVNAVAPGFIKTDMTTDFVNNPEVSAKILEAVPLKRFGEAADIAAATVFLCSEEAGYVTGQVFAVDGGMAM